MIGALIVVLVLARAGRSSSSRGPRSWCRSRAPSWSSGSGRYRATLGAGLPHPRAVRRRDPLPALAQGARGRHPGAGLHHARQRPGARRRRPLPEGAGPRARLLRHLRLSLRDHPARADDAAERDRQDRPRPHLRGAHAHQLQVVNEMDKASEPWGIKVLRYEIKNITPPAGRARRDGEADARRAREARRDPDLRGRARRRHQQRRGREAAGDQGVRGEASSSRSTRPRAQAAAILAVANATAEGIRRSPRRSRCPAASRRCSSASPSSTSASSASWPRRQHDDPAGERGRRRLDDRAGDERDRARAGERATPGR